MSYDHTGLLSDDHGFQCPECGCRKIYFSNRAVDRVVLRCGDCGKRFLVHDAKRVIHKMMSNADAIRTMTDEKLAQFIADNVDCSICEELNGYRPCLNSECCPDHWLNWLQSEARDERKDPS